jgi:hypothetical protein
MGKRKSKWYKAKVNAVSEPKPNTARDAATEPDWTRECEVCGQTPVVPVTGMCGLCTFGEADTAGGNW